MTDEWLSFDNFSCAADDFGDPGPVRIRLPDLIAALTPRGYAVVPANEENKRKPRCEVDGCKRVAAYAISTTLSWTRNLNLTTEVHVCREHTKAHEKTLGRALPDGGNHG